jgi:hypothetical protein
MTPEDALKQTKAIEKALVEINTMEVAVGITEESATKAIYKNKDGSDGASVLEVGAAHEFGIGVPQRSFLRATWIVKENEIKKIKKNIFLKMVDLSMSVEDGFDFLGVALSNFSKEAFNGGGFGEWQALSAETIAKKGNEKILVVTNTLRSSISYETRKISNAN